MGLLDSIKHSSHLSAIEGSLIDYFLSLLVSPEQEKKAPATIAPLKLKAGADFRLHHQGVMEIINYLKLIMESTRVNMSTFFSTEVG